MTHHSTLTDASERRHQLWLRINYKRRVWLLAILGLVTLVFYGWSYRGLAALDDEYVMLNVTANIVDFHTFELFTHYSVLHDLPTDPNAPAMSKYGIGQSALAIPLYTIGHLLPDFGVVKVGNQTLPLGPYRLALALDSIMTVLAMYGVVFTVQLLGYKWRTALIAGILYATATIAWPYAKTFYSEPTTACLLVGHLYWTIRLRRNGNIQEGLISGLCMGVAILTRTTCVVLVPFSLLYLLPYWKRWVIPLIGISAGIVLVLVYDQLRYGSPFATGYEGEWSFSNPIGAALLGFLFSPTRGMFVFNPILLLAIPGMWWLYRIVRRETIYLLAVIAAHTLLFSMWYFWDGGGSLASRFLVTLLPIGAVLLSPVIERPGWRIPLIGLTILSIGLQILWNLSQFTPVAAQSGLPQLTDQEWTWRFDRSYLVSAWPAYLNQPHTIDSSVVQAFQIADPVWRAVVFALGALIMIGLMFVIARRIPETPNPGDRGQTVTTSALLDNERTPLPHALAAR